MPIEKFVRKEHHRSSWIDSAKSILEMNDEEISILNGNEADESNESSEAMIALFRVYFMAYQLKKEAYWASAIQRSFYWRIIGKYEPITNLLVRIDAILEKMSQEYLELGEKIVISDESNRSKIRNLANLKTNIKESHLI